MRMSYLIGRRHKEKPAEATLISHIYLLRGGYMLVGKERKGQGQQRTVSILSRFCRTCHRWYDQ